MAALHGIVLAAVHVPTKVDMDIFGAFQLCAIGVLVAPVAATVSRTYFKNPGRNAIVLWSLLVVAGLISLAVEFYRVSSSPVLCTYEGADRIWNTSSPFPYENAPQICGIICNEDTPPFSPIRGGSADNIYLIPVPYVLTFNVCIMLTAACCIPAILLVAWMMVTSSHTNWTRRWGEQSGLALKVPVQLYTLESGLPDLATLRELAGSLNKLGVVGTQSYSRKRASQAEVLRRRSGSGGSADHNEVAVVDSSAASTHVEAEMVGFDAMLHRLHEKSALSSYEFDQEGSTVKLLEIKLDAEFEDFAHQLYNAMRDLENEDVDVICVESVEAEPDTPNGKVMSWLRNEQEAERGRPKQKRREKERSPGSVILLALFSLAVMAILIIGERNFFSNPVNYQTEPMANIGQWAPVAGTVLVVVGSIYVLIVEGMRKERRRMRADGKDVHDPDADLLDRMSGSVIRRLIRFNDMFDAPKWLFDHTEFQKAQRKYPLAPGEIHRNTGLSETVSKYEPQRMSTDSLRSVLTTRSMAVSVASRRETFPTRERTLSDTEPEAELPVRKRTLTLPGSETVVPPRRRSTRASTTDNMPMRPIVPHDGTSPIIVVSSEEPEDIEEEASAHEDHR